MKGVLFLVTKVEDRMSEKVSDHIKQNIEESFKVSQSIAENPEEFSQEYFASQILTDLFKQKGFSVQKGIKNYPTAFIARKKGKKQGRTIALFLEHTTLSENSYVQRNPLVTAISTSTALALAEVIDETGGEIVVYGTPATLHHVEKNAKDLLVEEGLCEEVDVGAMAYIGNKINTSVETMNALSLDIKFLIDSLSPKNQTKHPLDSMIQLFSQINEWRLSLSEDITIQGVILDGGKQPHLIPEEVHARYYIQAKTNHQVKQLEEKLITFAQEASMTNHHQLFVTPHPSRKIRLLENDPLQSIFQNKVEQLGETISTSKKEERHVTDLGNMSRFFPVLYPSIGGTIDCVTDSLTDQQKLKDPSEEQAIIFGATSIAYTMLEILINHQTYKKIKKNHLKKIEKYKSNLN